MLLYWHFACTIKQSKFLEALLYVYIIQLTFYPLWYNSYTDKVRERLHNAVRSESIDANEIREALAEFQELKLEEKDGDFARGCMLLEMIGLRQGKLKD